MNLKLKLLLVLFGSLSNSMVVAAQNNRDFDKRHNQCLDAISENTENAYEDALRWKDDGGGYRAEHCVAMALFGLERTFLAAKRLEKLGDDDYLPDKLRTDFYEQAADFYIISDKANHAYKLTSRVIELYPQNIDIRISRARAYVKLGRYDYSEKELDNVIALSPNHAAAFRYRADTKLRQNNLNGALSDIETSLELDPESIETALLRGEIREAIRLTNK